MNGSICIIGGGISGLTAGFLLSQKGFDVRLFERSDVVGGNIKTAAADGYVIEKGPNSLLKSPRLVNLIDALGMRSEVVPANPAANKRYVLQNGRLRALPMGLKDFVFGDFFSSRAKLRLLKEPFVRSRASGNESVAGFFERRLGGEIVAKAVDPFISGIYAGDAAKLSIEAAFPRLFEMERDHGSMLFGALRQKKEKTDPNFPRTFSFQKGLSALSDGIADKLADRIVTKSCVTKIRRSADIVFTVEFADSRKLDFDAVIIATPASSAADLIEEIDAKTAAGLRSIYYPPVAVVHMGFKANSVGFAPDGFGFLVPGSEKRQILGTLWNSSVFEKRAPCGYHLLTTFVGGALHPELFDLPDAGIADTVYGELHDIMNIGSKPEFTSVTRWPNAIPQYHIGYGKISAQFAEFENKNPGLYLCGNFYGGISIGDCVKNAYAVADRITNSLGAA